MHSKITDKVWFIFALVVFVYARIIAYLTVLPFDDAYITFLYAENLVNGLGFVFNPGERVLGTTTPIYTLLCAALYAVGFNLVKTMPFVNLLAEIGIIALTWYSLLRGQSVFTKLVFVSLLAISPTAGNVSAGAMEAPLFMLVVLASMVLAPTGRVAKSAVLSAFSYFIRPEGVLAAAVVTLNRLLHRDMRAFFVSALICSAIAAIGIAFTYWYFGTLFSQTIIAKAHANPGGESIKRLFYREPVQVLSLLIAVFGLRAAWKAEASLRLVIAFAALYLLAYVVAQPWIRLWYVYPPYIGIFLLAALGADEIVRRIRFLQKEYLPFLLLVATVIAASVLWLKIYPATEYDKQKQLVNLYDPLAEWCRETQPKSVYAGDIGQIGYHCRGTQILDGAALVWTPAMPYLGHPDFLYRIVKDFKPDYVFANTIQSNMEHMQKLKKDYIAVRRFSSKGSTRIEKGEAVQDFNEVKDWYPDYYLFKKRSVTKK